MWNLTANGFTEYDTIKVKLRIDDDSMRDEIRLYMHEVDDLIINRLIAKLGVYNVYGQKIVYPLTSDTIPPVPLELKAIANDLVVAKIRLQNSEKPLLWDSAVKVLDNYLDRVYGWTSHKPYEPIRELTISPTSGNVGATITISGINFQPSAKIDFVFNATTPTTTPATVISTTTGAFSTVTFVVPANHPAGSYEIKVSDSFGGQTIRFQVTE